MRAVFVRRAVEGAFFAAFTVVFFVVTLVLLVDAGLRDDVRRGVVEALDFAFDVFDGVDLFRADVVVFALDVGVFRFDVVAFLVAIWSLPAK